MFWAKTVLPAPIKQIFGIISKFYNHYVAVGSATSEQKFLVNFKVISPVLQQLLNFSSRIHPHCTQHFIAAYQDNPVEKITHGTHVVGHNTQCVASSGWSAQVFRVEKAMLFAQIIDGRMFGLGCDAISLHSQKVASKSF